jgi:prepilin-type N-terminal cleavage/methylation domain-containing protein/prepilin-type processing-associated H-X9-DG protein
VDRKLRDAFTLIELLVVIAIVAILAAILFPVFAQAREKARSAACLSNCKQLGTAIQVYLQDYDGAYPLAWYGMRVEYGFDVALFPYLRNYKVYECPSNRVTPRFWSGYRRMGVSRPIPGSYTMNADLTARDATGGRVPFAGREGRTGLTETAVQAPAETILLCEIWDTRASWKPPVGPEHEIYTTQKNDVCQRIPFHIHQGGSHYVFCDGHAKWQRVEQTWKQWRADSTELEGDATECEKRQRK